MNHLLIESKMMSMADKKNRTYKCAYSHCNHEKHLITVDQNSINNIVRYGDKYYHSECFKNWCNYGIDHYKNNKKYIDALNNIEEYKKDANSRLSKNSENDEFYQFIMDKYGVKQLPNSIFIRLNKVFTGKLPNINKNGIPKEHMYDMWKRKSNELDKIRAKTIVKGYNMNVEQSIMYDISVLISKYDSYLSWLNRQKMNEISPEDNSIDRLTKDIKSATGNYNMKKNDDISDLVDDIFND